MFRYIDFTGDDSSANKNLSHCLLLIILEYRCRRGYFTQDVRVPLSGGCKGFSVKR